MLESKTKNQRDRKNIFQYNLFVSVFFYYKIISSLPLKCFDIFFEYINGKNILGFSSAYEGRIASFLGKELKIAHYVVGFGFLSISYYFEKTKKY